MCVKNYVSEEVIRDQRFKVTGVTTLMSSKLRVTSYVNFCRHANRQTYRHTDAGQTDISTEELVYH